MEDRVFRSRLSFDHFHFVLKRPLLRHSQGLSGFGHFQLFAKRRAVYEAQREFVSPASSPDAPAHGAAGFDPHPWNRLLEGPCQQRVLVFAFVLPENLDTQCNHYFFFPSLLSAFRLRKGAKSW